ncbi:hypothetical protein LIER_17124 [Lithospermum erythrorhizon]|uniref:Uncharacterized protein n=1 Tax=Lithospermum erythrorhizon TaxID=34254 RepID=A0AAV3QAV7_LITER
MEAGGGGAPPPKYDELQPHPVKDQLPNVSYCITSPPPWRESFDICLKCSYTFVPTTISIILAHRYKEIDDPQEKFEKVMRGVQGALIVTSILQIAHDESIDMIIALK